MQDARSVIATFDEPTVLRCIAMLESIGGYMAKRKYYGLARSLVEPSFVLREVDDAVQENIDTFSGWMAEYSRLDALSLALESWLHVRFLKKEASNSTAYRTRAGILRITSVLRTAHDFTIGLSCMQHLLFDDVYLEATQGMSIDEKMECYLRVLELERVSVGGGFPHGGTLDCLSN